MCLPAEFPQKYSNFLINRFIEVYIILTYPLESISASYEPRYSCHLSKNNGVIIESVKSPLRNQSSYPLLKRDDDVTEADDSNDPDYEEMDDDEYNTLISSSGISNVKPPLPDRVYHELEPPRTRHHSESL